MNRGLHDLRYGLRQMGESRGFTATALIVLAVRIGAREPGIPALTIMTLAVGIPASTATVGAINAVLRYQ
jgi:hypothetical protein